MSTVGILYSNMSLRSWVLKIHENNIHRNNARMTSLFVLSCQLREGYIKKYHVSLHRMKKIKLLGSLSDL